MKKLLFFVALAAALLLLVLGAEALGLEGSISLLCLPFVLCARGLRWLSLSGSVGNILAIILLILLGLTPLLLKIRKKWAPVDLLLVLCCGAIWAAEYYLINPGLLPITLSGNLGQLTLCGIVYELLLCWAVIRLLKNTHIMDTRNYLQALKIFLWLCAGSCCLSGILCFTSLPNAFRTLQETNTMPGLKLGHTYFFMTLSRAVSALEYGLDGLVLFLGAGLLKVLEKGPYTEEAVSAAEKVRVWCRRSLLAILLSHTGLNLAQTIFASRLHQMSTEFRFPLLSLAIVFAMLALSGLLKKGQQLQEDNDLFI
jgi:hypothetical protein